MAADELGRILVTCPTDASSKLIHFYWRVCRKRVPVLTHEPFETHFQATLSRDSTFCPRPTVAPRDAWVTCFRFAEQFADRSCAWAWEAEHSEGSIGWAKSGISFQWRHVWGRNCSCGPKSACAGKRFITWTSTSFGRQLLVSRENSVSDCPSSWAHEHWCCKDFWWNCGKFRWISGTVRYYFQIFFLTFLLVDHFKRNGASEHFTRCWLAPNRSIV